MCENHVKQVDKYLRNRYGLKWKRETINDFLQAPRGKLRTFFLNLSQNKRNNPGEDGLIREF